MLCWKQSFSIVLNWIDMSVTVLQLSVLQLQMVLAFFPLSSQYLLILLFCLLCDIWVPSHTSDQPAILKSTLHHDFDVLLVRRSCLVAVKIRGVTWSLWFSEPLMIRRRRRWVQPVAAVIYLSALWSILKPSPQSWLAKIFSLYRLSVMPECPFRPYRPRLKVWQTDTENDHETKSVLGDGSAPFGVVLQ